MRVLEVIPAFVIEGADRRCVPEGKEALHHVLKRTETQHAVILNCEFRAKQARKLAGPSLRVPIGSVGRRPSKCVYEFRLRHFSFVDSHSSTKRIMVRRTKDTRTGKRENEWIWLETLIQSGRYGRIQMQVAGKEADVRPGFSDQCKTQIERQPHRTLPEAGQCYEGDCQPEQVVGECGPLLHADIDALAVRPRRNSHVDIVLMDANNTQHYEVGGRQELHQPCEMPRTSFRHRLVFR